MFYFLRQCDVVSKELLSFDLEPNINNSMTKLRIICVLNGTKAPLKMRTILYTFATNQKKTFLAKLTQFTGKPLKVIEQNCTFYLKGYCFAACTTLLLGVKRLTPEISLIYTSLEQKLETKFYSITLKPPRKMPVTHLYKLKTS